MSKVKSQAILSDFFLQPKKARLKGHRVTIFGKTLKHSQRIVLNRAKR